MYINGIRRMLLDLKQSIQNTVLNENEAVRKK